MMTCVRRSQGMAAVMISALSALACGEQDAPGLFEPAPSLSLNQQATIQLCHQPEHAAELIEVSDAARAAHLRHGDYIARLVVQPSSGLAADGVHFTRITDAVLSARQERLAHGETVSAACRITIEVGPGTYLGSFDAGADPDLERFPLLIDVPDITLRGALDMGMDGRGRATGQGRTATDVTALVPDRPLQFLPNTEAMIVVVGHPGGSAGSGVVIEGFEFRSGRSDASDGGMGIIALRARDLLVRGNRFEAGLSSAADLRSSSARIERNYGRHLGVNCGFCLAGPGDYQVEGNRLLDGGLGGIYVSAAIAHMDFSLGAAPVASVEPDVLPAAAGVSASIRNNDLRGHVRLPIGFAVRTLALGPGTSGIPQTSHVRLEDNDMLGNTFGLIVDAGFPQANTLRRGDVDVALTGNSIQGSCQSDLLVSYTRHTGGLGLTTNPYLLDSTFRLDLGGDLVWGDAWFSHPSGFGNTLITDGATIDNGTRQLYDPTGCPGRTN